MGFNFWFIVAGVLFVVMALSVTALRRLPLTTSVLSLFTAGLKLRLPLRDDRWRLTLRLAFVSMTLTVGLIAAAGVYWLGLPLGAAILLGGVLAATDPVLASDVQTKDPWDKDRLRFSPTGEAGLNDGTAFPFVMLGLGLLGLHELGAYPRLQHQEPHQHAAQEIRREAYHARAVEGVEQRDDDDHAEVIHHGERSQEYSERRRHAVAEQGGEGLKELGRRMEQVKREQPVRA